MSIEQTTRTTSVEQPTLETEIAEQLFDGHYKGDELTQQIVTITGHRDHQAWTVIDTEGEGSLVMIHHVEHDLKYSHVRGDVIDTEVGAVIAKSFGHTPTAVADQLELTDDMLSVTDQEGYVHTFDPSSCKMRRGVECVILRAIRHQGKMYLMTHTRFDPSRSRWGNSPSFVSMYEQAGGPTEEQLFDTTKPHSSTCYVFAVVHPDLLVGTRQIVHHPYIVHLGDFEMDTKRSAEEVAPGVHGFETELGIPSVVTEPGIYQPKDLSLEEVNHHLQSGFYQPITDPIDSRQQTGEMVIIYSVDPEDPNNILDIVKVHSPSYEWRTVMRGNNSNITHQFFNLLNLAYSNDWDMLERRLILFPLYDEQSIRELYEQRKSILMIPPGRVSRNDFKNRQSKIQLIWMNYVLSLPPCHQEKALDILSDFTRDRADVIRWLQQLERKFPEIEQEDYSNRVKGIVVIARKLARNRRNDGNNFSRNGNFMRLPQLIRGTIRNLIMKEKGPSLYGLIRDMKRERRDQQQ